MSTGSEEPRTGPPDWLKRLAALSGLPRTTQSIFLFVSQLSPSRGEGPALLPTRDTVRVTGRIVSVAGIAVAGLWLYCAIVAPFNLVSSSDAVGDRLPDGLIHACLLIALWAGVALALVAAVAGADFARGREPGRRMLVGVLWAGIAWLLGVAVVWLPLTLGMAGAALRSELGAPAVAFAVVAALLAPFGFLLFLSLAAALYCGIHWLNSAPVREVCGDARNQAQASSSDHSR
ncbi:MAG: hypothetical protein JSV65_00680 [Armatimonadota bacterium]|nr:MAG: hypothetical protein JSV65_00680 [Armatimonadota bacterium]